jgi:GNAT superfamily N-acetyltransferase
MDYLIRECTEDDLPSLITLCGKHAEYERTAYHPEGKQDLLKKALFCHQPEVFCLIAESDHRVVGYAAYTFCFSTWSAGRYLDMDCLYLEAEYRGFGIGEKIIRQLQGIAAIKGCIEMQWQTPSFNERAIRFYKRIGATGKDKVRFFLPVAGREDALCEG